MRYLDQLYQQHLKIMNEIERYKKRLVWRELFSDILAKAGNGSLFTFACMLKANGYSFPDFDLYEKNWEVYYGLDGLHSGITLEGRYDIPTFKVQILDTVRERGDCWSEVFEEKEFATPSEVLEYIK